MGLRPLTLVLPLVICGVLLGVGLFGILQAAHSQRDQARTKASYLEQIVANSMLAGLQVSRLQTGMRGMHGTVIASTVACAHICACAPAAHECLPAVSMHAMG